MPSGFLVLDKPVGVRSTQCVERVRALLGGKTKVGHGGTLDSTASGTLVILIGEATRLSDLVMAFPKVYRAEVAFGTETLTDDYSGEPLKTSPFDTIDARRIDAQLVSFLGWRLQLPPNVSALRTGGERAHRKIRSGADPELAPRPVFIERICRTSVLSPTGHVAFEILCSKGTYVRAFARDLGRQLECCAHLSGLVRTRIGPYSCDAPCAVRWEELDEKTPWQEKILPISSCDRGIVSYGISEEQRISLMQGKPLRLDALAGRRIVSQDDQEEDWEFRKLSQKMGVLLYAPGSDAFHSFAEWVDSVPYPILKPRKNLLS